MMLISNLKSILYLGINVLRLTAWDLNLVGYANEISLESVAMQTGGAQRFRSDFK